MVQTSIKLSCLFLNNCSALSDAGNLGSQEMFIVLERGWVRMGFHFHSFLKENIHPADSGWHIRTSLSHCQHSRQRMAKATGKVARKSTASQPGRCKLQLKWAKNDSWRPKGSWMDRGCLKGTEQRLGPVKFQSDTIGMVTQIESMTRLSQRLLVLCANQTALFISTSKPPCSVELELLLKMAQAITWNITSS